MENHSLSDITASSAPFQASLASNESQALNYGYCSTWGSLPNYLCLTSGQTLVGNCDNNPSVCGRFSATNIVDLLTTAGLNWKAYMEGMSSPNICNGGGFFDGGTQYVSHHDPFIYYTDIANDTTRCKQVVPAGAYGGISHCNSTLPSVVADTMIGDLQNLTTAPNFMWLTPNNNDNSHDCPVGIGNTYLRTLVPLILESPTFTQARSALFITYDEGHDSSIKEQLYAVFSGREVNPNYNSTVSYSHYSALHTIELNWNLPGLTVNDTSAPTMNSFFVGGSSVGGRVTSLNRITLLFPYLILGSTIACAILINVFLRRNRTNPTCKWETRP